jgi:hypothetical protein
MSDYDPLTIPAVMQQSVRRTKPEGFPTQALLDYEQALQGWMQANTTNMNERFNSVESSIGDTSAEVEEVIQALTDGTGAYGTYITTINTKANGASASGQVYLLAKAAPSGAAAAYGWYIQADGSFAGMEALALSGGGSAIGFTANQFLFTDAGTAQPVFTYSGGKFGFTGDVAIDGGLTIDGTVTALGVAGGFSTRGSVGDTVDISGVFTTWTDLGAPLTLSVEPDAVTGEVHPLIFVRDQANATNTGGVSPIAAYVAVRLLMDGTPVYTHDVINELIDPATFKTLGLTDFMETLAAGASHTFQLQYQCNYPVGMDGEVFAKVMVFMISR